jgi:signal transduction histidine kinase
MTGRIPDDGLGIPSRFAHLFQRFTRGNASLAGRRLDGAGLAIVDVFGAPGGRAHIGTASGPTAFTVSPPAAP